MNRYWQLRDIGSDKWHPLEHQRKCYIIKSDGLAKVKAESRF